MAGSDRWDTLADGGGDVQFINTDGLSFIGPGSEWFWTALSGIVLAVTFVAVFRQLRDNAKLLRSQAHYNALHLLDRPWEMLIEHGDLSVVVSRVDATPESASDSEWARYFAYSAMQFNGWEYCYYQYRDGSIPKELWLGTDAAFRGFIRTKPGLARAWSESRHFYEEPFRSLVDQAFKAEAERAVPESAARRPPGASGSAAASLDPPP